MVSGERRERERQEMRDMILAAAMKLFLEESFEKTTMRRIAESIEYTPGALYSYFKDKDEILYSLQLRGFEIMYTLQSEAAAKETDPVKRLRRIGETYLEFAFANPQYYDLMFISESTARTIAETGAWEPGKRAYELLRGAVSACIDAGRFDGPADADVISLAMWAYVHGLTALHLRGRILTPAPQRLELIQRSFAWLASLAPK